MTNDKRGRVEGSAPEEVSDDTPRTEAEMEAMGSIMRLVAVEAVHATSQGRWYPKPVADRILVVITEQRAESFAAGQAAALGEVRERVEGLDVCECDGGHEQHLPVNDVLAALALPAEAKKGADDPFGWTAEYEVARGYRQSHHDDCRCENCRAYRALAGPEEPHTGSDDPTS